MKRVNWKYIFIAIGIMAVVYVGYMIIASLVLNGAFEKRYTRKDAIDNYFNREKEITLLVSDFSSLVPDVKTNKGVSFGLGKSRNSFGIGIFLLDGSVLENYPGIDEGSDLKLDSDKADTLLKILKWRNETIIDLKEKLEKANCENISSKGEDAFVLDFKYSGFGLHSYVIFNKPLPDSLITWYNNKGDTVIRKNVIVRYSSGL